MKQLTKEFTAKLNQLQDDVESKDAQLAILESEMQDAVSASNKIIDIKSIVMDMLFEVVKFEKAKGETEKTKSNKQRLESLLDMIDGLNGLANMAYNLKGSNKRLHTAYQVLRVENADLKTELKRMTDAEAFLNKAS